MLREETMWQDDQVCRWKRVGEKSGKGIGANEVDEGKQWKYENVPPSLHKDENENGEYNDYIAMQTYVSVRLVFFLTIVAVIC